jgi:hypothetical protein
METRGSDRLAIAHIVKPGRHDDSLRDIKTPCSELLSKTSDGLDMEPPVARPMQA